MHLRTMSKFVILDRDGTINKDTGHTYRMEDLEILPGAIEGLQKFRDAGFKFIVVTNQAGIARGIFTLDDLNKFQTELSRHLEIHGIKIEKTYHCPHHPKFTGECLCRKPNIGLVRLAEKELKFDATESIIIGDKDSDIGLGKNCKAITVLIENNQYDNSVQPDFKARNLKHAFELLRTAKII